LYFEQPLRASSWKVQSVQQVESHSQVQKIRVDQCMHGLVCTNGTPMQKPTCIMINMRRLESHVGRICDASHKHVILVGSVRGGGKKHRLSSYAETFQRLLAKGLAERLQADMLADDAHLCYEEVCSNEYVAHKMTVTHCVYAGALNVYMMKVLKLLVRSDYQFLMLCVCLRWQKCSEDTRLLQSLFQDLLGQWPCRYIWSRLMQKRKTRHFMRRVRVT